MASLEASNSALRAELGIHLVGLREALAGFTRHIQVEARDAWIWRRPNGRVDAMTPLPPDVSREHTLEVIAEALNDIKYTDGQDAHESRIAPGVLVLSEEGLSLAGEVNRQKRALAAVLRSMQGRTEEGVVDQRTGSGSGLCGRWLSRRSISGDYIIGRRLGSWWCCGRVSGRSELRITSGSVGLTNVSGCAAHGSGGADQAAGGGEGECGGCGSVRSGSFGFEEA